MKKIIISLFLFIICSQISFTASSGDSLKFKTNPAYIHQVKLYKVYSTKQADLVMLGNSITHGVNWNELLDRDDVVERGIPGDIIEGYINRLDYVFNLKPKVCFIMGGINDIYNWTPLEEIFNSYVNLVNQIRSRDITVVIQSTLYVSPKWHNAENRNAEVEKLNELLSEFARSNGIIFVDLNSNMSFNKMLIDDLTTDGVHLNAKGYKIWGREVEKVLNNQGF